MALILWDAFLNCYKLSFVFSVIFLRVLILTLLSVALGEMEFTAYIFVFVKVITD